MIRAAKVSRQKRRSNRKARGSSESPLHVVYVCDADHESTVEWSNHGPKHTDLAWKRKDGGAWIDCGSPLYVPSQSDYYRKRDTNQSGLFA